MKPGATRDKRAIRTLLNQEREWALYALADLDVGVFEQCDWWTHERGLALVYRALSILPIFILGDAGIARELLEGLPAESGYLNLLPHQLEAARGIYDYRDRHEMHRMILGDFEARAGDTVRLATADLPEIQELYRGGQGAAIAFDPSQVDTGLFRGVRRGRELVAVAGVHVVSRDESVAAVGNVYTRADCRGLGLAQIATSAVVTALREAGIGMIGLNVEQSNTAAIRAYERIGFRTRLSYFEGVADRVS